MNSPKENINVQTKNWTTMDYLKAIGPGAIIAASIVGPGTVTTASIMGATYRYHAIWVLALSVIMCYFFQEPAIRITLSKGVSLMEGIREQVDPKASGFLYAAVIAGAIAFQAGNFAGAGMALNYFVPGLSVSAWALTMSVAALIVSWTGVYKILENFNRVLIVMMVLAFVITAFVSGPSIGNVVTEGFSFKIPGGDYWLVLALLATTMPPNLVLAFSALLKKKYIASKDDTSYLNKVNLARFDLKANMVITALITGAIVVCAGTIIFVKGIEIKSAADMAIQLTPLLGRYAGVLFALGLWAAAFSSGLYQISIQPMLMNQAFGWEEDVKANRSRIVMVITSIVPVIIVWAFRSMPVGVIVTAQALNGLALPFVVAIVWKLCNKREYLGKAANTTVQNVIYGTVMVLVSFFALRVFLRIFGIL